MSTPEREAVEVFLQEAAEHLQYLREYVGVLQDVEPQHEDLERLYIAAHTLSGTSASYGFPRFSEIAGKLAHVFQYALNAPLGEDLHGPLTEFLSDGISLLETDLLEIRDTGNESLEDVAACDLLAAEIAGLAGHAELIFGALVIGLEIGVGQRPVDDR